MPMELLRELAQTTLPCTRTEDHDLDRLRILRAAGYIAALLPAPGSSSQMGRVLAVTRAGREALAVESESSERTRQEKSRQGTGALI